MILRRDKENDNRGRGKWILLQSCAFKDSERLRIRNQKGEQQDEYPHDLQHDHIWHLAIFLPLYSSVQLSPKSATAEM